MDERIKNLIDKMSNEMMKKNGKFLFDNLNNKESIIDVVNLLVSAHMSSLFSLLLTTAKNENDDAQIFVLRIISYIEGFLKIMSHDKFENNSIN